MTPNPFRLGIQPEDRAGNSVLPVILRSLGRARAERLYRNVEQVELAVGVEPHDSADAVVAVIDLPNAQQFLLLNVSGLTWRGAGCGSRQHGKPAQETSLPNLHGMAPSGARSQTMSGTTIGVSIPSP